MILFDWIKQELGITIQTKTFVIDTKYLGSNKIWFVSNILFYPKFNKTTTKYFWLQISTQNLIK